MHEDATIKYELKRIRCKRPLSIKIDIPGGRKLRRSKFVAKTKVYNMK